MGEAVVALLAAAVMGSGASASVHTAIVEQRRALAALPGSTGSAAQSYRKTLAHVNSGMSALLAAQSALATDARGGPVPNVASIQTLLDEAISADIHVSAALGGVLPFASRGVPLPPVSQMRSDLRQALTAAVSLGRLTAGL